VESYTILRVDTSLSGAPLFEIASPQSRRRSRGIISKNITPKDQKRRWKTEKKVELLATFSRIPFNMYTYSTPASASPPAKHADVPNPIDMGCSVCRQERPYLLRKCGPYYYRHSNFSAQGMIRAWSPKWQESQQ
jgi:hypothetical protein